MPKTDLTVEVIGQDGNTMSIMGRVSKTLKRAGHYNLASEMTDRVLDSGSYDEALNIMQEYVTFE